MADFRWERKCRRLGFDVILGVDEAGRGPLAGPLVTAAVYLKAYRFKARIDDSKKLSAKERERAFSEIIQKSIFALSLADEKTIDSLNVLNATRLSMENALKALLARLPYKRPCALVDGDIKINLAGLRVFNITRGDSLSKTIAAASILAKVSRDRIMSLYDLAWPQYGFLKHKGYPTFSHRSALRRFGCCPGHRLTFSHV